MSIIPKPIRTRHQHRPSGTFLLILTAVGRPPDNWVPWIQPLSSSSSFRMQRRRRQNHKQPQNHTKSKAGKSHSRIHTVMCVWECTLFIETREQAVCAAMQKGGVTPMRGGEWQWWAQRCRVSKLYPLWFLGFNWADYKEEYAVIFVHQMHDLVKYFLLVSEKLKTSLFISKTHPYDWIFSNKLPFKTHYYLVCCLCDAHVFS